MPNLPFICRLTTTWTKTGEFDEEAYRQLLQKYIDSDIDIFMASAATEGRSLTYDELLRVYQVGVEYCKGKIIIGASGCEENTAAATAARAKIGVEAGVDVVNIYGPAGWHGYRPTDAEYLAFFDNVLSDIDYPIAVCPNKTLGYLARPALLAQVCNTHPQVVSAVLTGAADEMYFIDLREHLTRDLEIYVELYGSLEMLGMHPTGLAGNVATILPKTTRQFLDLAQAHRFDEASRVYYDLRRYETFCLPWNNGQITRTVKMAMRAFNWPGAEGGLREPNLMPNDEEYEKFVDGLLKLNIPELNEMALAAGLPVPSSSN